MKNIDKWKPSKAIQDSDGNWVVNFKGEDEDQGM